MEGGISEEKVKRYYELKQQIDSLKSEAEKINLEIKHMMRQENIAEICVGNYLLELKLQDRSKFNNTIINYFREIGHEDLIMETYDSEKVKELEKLGKLDEKEIQKYKIEKITPSLYIKEIRK